MACGTAVALCERVATSGPQDSNEDGLGYEAVIKSTYGGIYGEPTRAGTKTVRSAAHACDFSLPILVQHALTWTNVSPGSHRSV